MKKPNFKKVTGKSMVARVAIPLGCALLGSMIGSAAGKTANLAVGGGLGVLGVAMDNPNFIYAGAGAVAVTPTTGLFDKPATAGIDGLDGFKDSLTSAKNRAFGQARSVLSNAKLGILADKIPVSGIDGLGSLDEVYETAYLQGVNDTVDELGEGDDMAGLNGYSYGQQLPGQRQSIESLMAR